jgi:hypothetical protein
MATDGVRRKPILNARMFNIAAMCLGIEFSTLIFTLTTEWAGWPPVSGCPDIFYPRMGVGAFLLLNSIVVYFRIRHSKSRWAHFLVLLVSLKILLMAAVVLVHIAVVVVKYIVDT